MIPRVVSALIKLKHFDINRSVPTLGTPLHRVCSTDLREIGQLETIEMLLKCANLDVTITDEQGKTAIDLYLERSTHLKAHQGLEAGEVD